MAVDALAPMWTRPKSDTPELTSAGSRGVRSSLVVAPSTGPESAPRVRVIHAEGPRRSACGPAATKKLLPLRGAAFGEDRNEPVIGARTELHTDNRSARRGNP